MTTSKFLAALLATLIALSVVASFWKPKFTKDGKTSLTWVSDNNPARAAQIETFNKENPNLNLRLDYGNVGVQKIILQSSSGVGPDIFDFGDDQMESYVNAGILWDVTDAAQKMGFSGEEAGYPGGIDTYTYEGRQYGFPCNTGSSILIFNKNVFDHFGIPYPDKEMTWDDFFVLAQKVNSHTNPNGAKGERIFAVTGLDWKHFFDSQRGEFFDERGGLNILNNEALRRSFDMHRDMIYRYRITPTTVEAKQMSGQGGYGSSNLNQFCVNRYAMLISGHWSLIAFGRFYEKQIATLKQKGTAIESIKNPLARPLRLGATLYPYFAGSQPHYRVGSRVAGINSHSPNREEALKFLQFLAGPSYAKLLNEGTDFLPGNPKYADLGADPGPPDLSRPELQAATVKAMNYGYVPRNSPFLFLGDVLRVLRTQISRLESNPNITTDDILNAANKELVNLVRRNLDRDVELKNLFIERFGEDTYKNLR